MSAQVPAHSVRVKMENESGSASPRSASSAPEFDSFPLRACSQEDIDETRFHIMKFHTVKTVDFEADFENPTRLHRKDPKNLQFQMSMKELDQKKIDDKRSAAEHERKREEYMARRVPDGRRLTTEEIDEEMELEGLDEEERKLKIQERKLLAEEKRRRQEREDRQKNVAPGGGRRSRRQLLKRKTRQIRAYNEDKRKLRYEEFYPWVLEDYDAKQAWVGSYDAGNTDNCCLLVLDMENKCFKLMPLEKYYRFTPRNKYATLTLEEAEAKMEKGSSGQRWLMRKMREEAASGERLDLRYRKFEGGSGPHTPAAGDAAVDPEDAKKSDDEDVDFDEDFQDDEEAPILEGNDEENKLVEGKMKKNMLRANNLIEASDAESDSDIDDLFETRKVDKGGKKLRKALAQNAMNEVYDSDDEENNPYLSESEIEKEESDDGEDKIVTVKLEPGATPDGDLTVKQEEMEIDGTVTANGATNGTKKKRLIYVSQYNDGVVTFKFPEDILSQFPEGVWNPDLPPRKKIKLRTGRAANGTHATNGANDSHAANGINGAHATNGAHAVHTAHTTNGTSATNGAQPYEITKSDVDELLVDGSIPLQSLVRSLRVKMSRDPNAKKNLKRVLKDNFALRNKVVYRKTT